MNRRQFLGLSSATSAALLIPSKLRALESEGTPGPITLKSKSFTLALNPGKGLDCTLTHDPSGTVLAKSPYFYSIGNPTFDRVNHDNNTYTIMGKTDAGIEVEHSFRLYDELIGLEEEILIRNTGTGPFKGEPRFAFTLPRNTWDARRLRFHRSSVSPRTERRSHAVRRLQARPDSPRKTPLIHAGRYAMGIGLHRRRSHHWRQ
jgi:hypothetical protein